MSVKTRNDCRDFDSIISLPMLEFYEGFFIGCEIHLPQKLELAPCIQ